MSTSSYDSTFSLKTEQRFAPTGATNGLFISGNSVAGCNTVWLQHMAGGTLFILSDGSGSTLSAAALAAASSTGSMWIPALQPPFAIPGPAGFYLYASGATATVNLMYGKSQG